jgi:hypothetical protein
MTAWAKEYLEFVITEQKMSETWEEMKTKVVGALNERGADKLPCPRCGNSGFALVDGFFSHPLQKETAGLVLGGPVVPAVATVCMKCGFISEHALGVLGLLPKEDK